LFFFVDGKEIILFVANYHQLYSTKFRQEERKVKINANYVNDGIKKKLNCILV